jgi:hypothetical protein
LQEISKINGYEEKSFNPNIIISHANIDVGADVSGPMEESERGRAQGPATDGV